MEFKNGKVYCSLDLLSTNVSSSILVIDLSLMIYSNFHEISCLNNELYKRPKSLYTLDKKLKGVYQTWFLSSFHLAPLHRGNIFLSSLGICLCSVTRKSSFLNRVEDDPIFIMKLSFN